MCDKDYVLIIYTGSQAIPINYAYATVFINLKYLGIVIAH